MRITQPVEALVASVLADEWVVVSDTEYVLCLNHDTHNLELTFAKNIADYVLDDLICCLRVIDAEWMTKAEKDYFDGAVNDWWAKRSKVLDAERRAEARNKFMCLVKEIV
jgi:hypothetical protein